MSTIGSFILDCIDNNYNDGGYGPSTLKELIDYMKESFPNHVDLFKTEFPHLCRLGFIHVDTSHEDGQVRYYHTSQTSKSYYPIPPK